MAALRVLNEYLEEKKISEPQEKKTLFVYLHHVKLFYQNKTILFFLIYAYKIIIEFSSISRDIENYQGLCLCYLSQPSGDNTTSTLIIFDIMLNLIQ